MMKKPTPGDYDPADYGNNPRVAAEAYARDCIEYEGRADNKILGFFIIVLPIAGLIAAVWKIVTVLQGG